MRTLVAGIDSSTQSCKVMIRDSVTGALVRSGMARHSAGTEIDPNVWLRAMDEALRQAGGLDDVAALSVAGQQHGMVALDSSGRVVRDAILWNDTRSGEDAEDLVVELGQGNPAEGRALWAERVGSVPVASLTITKLRWFARHELKNFSRTAAIALPHDWLTWRLQGGTDVGTITTDRSDASGTGYFDAVTDTYQEDLIELATGQSLGGLVLPRVLKPSQPAGEVGINGRNLVVGPGCGDNAGAALGLNLRPGQVVLSIGTSGVVSMISNAPTHDSSGYVAGFADARGGFLPLVATLNASRVLDAYASLLGADHARFSELALTAPPGAEGLVCIPYLEGERTPNLPNATGALHGIQVANLTPANIARAAIEGMLCGVGEGIRAMQRLGVDVDSIILIGGGARSEAVRRIAPSVLGLPVHAPERGEYVADGAAAQAAWVLSGEAAPPQWIPRMSSEFVGQYHEFIAERYHEISHLVSSRNPRFATPLTSIVSTRAQRSTS